MQVLVLTEGLATWLNIIISGNLLNVVHNSIFVPNPPDYLVLIPL